MTWKRRLARLMLGVVACYLGVILLLLWLENWLLYHPARYTDSWQAPPPGQVEDVALQSADGTRLHAWWCPTASGGRQPPGNESRGAMLYCHGNAGNLSHRADAIRDWQKEMGGAVLIFDYPGYGRSEGKPSEAGCYAAAEAAYDWLVADKQVRPHDIVILGRSLGGGVATHLASQRRHGALVLFSTFTSIPDVAQALYPWLPCRWLVRNRFDNLARIGQCTQPVFFAHGTEDSLVPLAQGEKVFEAANEPKEFLTMPGMGHDAPLSPAFYHALRNFLAKVEPSPKR